MTTAAATTNEAPQAEETATNEDAADILADVLPGYFGKSEPEQKSAPKAKKPEKQEKAAAKKAPEPEQEETEETDVTETEEQADGEEATEETEEEAKGDPFSLLRLDELFSDKALGTKEGIAKARETILTARKAAREMHHEAHTEHMRAKRHETDARRYKDTAKSELANVRTLSDRVNRDIDTLHNGTADEVMEALGRLTNRNGAEVYDQMTTAVVQNGKQKPKSRDPEVERELAEIRAEKERIRTERQAAQRTQWLTELDREIASNGETYKAISHNLKNGKAAELVRWAEELARGHAQASGTWPSHAELLGHMENELRPYLPPESPLKKKPATNGSLPGRTLSPTRAATSAPRTLDGIADDPDELARQAPDILRDMGIFR